MMCVRVMVVATARQPPKIALFTYAREGRAGREEIGGYKLPIIWHTVYLRTQPVRALCVCSLSIFLFFSPFFFII